LVAPVAAARPFAPAFFFDAGPSLVAAARFRPEAFFGEALDFGAVAGTAAGMEVVTPVPVSAPAGTARLVKSLNEVDGRKAPNPSSIAAAAIAT
jgi:hypothetical protein